MAARKILFCPKCLRPVQARDYFTTAGISDFRAETGGSAIKCPECNYSGPPVQATPEEYEKIRKEK